MWQVVFTKRAAKDVKKLSSAHLDGKAKALLAIIEQDPFRRPPGYEELKGNLGGLISRRINIKHRLVYQVIPAEDGEGGTVKVLSMWSHYENL